jgi:hypothetical protein
LERIKPPTESTPSLRSQLRIAIVGIDGRVQQRAPARYQSSTPVPKVPDNLSQAVNGIWDLLRSIEARSHCGFPSMVEGVSRKLLFTLKVPVNSTFFESCRSHEIGKRGAAIPFPIEDRRRLANDLLPRLLTFAHVCAPSDANTATVVAHGILPLLR